MAKYLFGCPLSLCLFALSWKCCQNRGWRIIMVSRWIPVIEAGLKIQKFKGSQKFSWIPEQKESMLEKTTLKLGKVLIKIKQTKENIAKKAKIKAKLNCDLIGWLKGSGKKLIYIIPPPVVYYFYMYICILAIIRSLLDQMQIIIYQVKNGTLKTSENLLASVL